MTVRFPALLVAFLLAAGPSLAQATPATAPPALLAAAPAALVPDTAAALHRLFAAKRKRNPPFVAGTLAVATLGGMVIGTASSSQDRRDQAVLGVAIIGFVSLPALVLETFLAIDYSKKNERWAVEDFQAHRLARHLKRKLKPRFFQEPGLRQ